MALRKKGKWRDLGMVFKPSFKCIKKNKKTNKKQKKTYFQRFCD